MAEYRIVETTAGKVRGEVQDGIEIFRGVPYGSALGRRFRAPKPPDPWEGVRDALEFGPPGADTSYSPPGKPPSDGSMRAGFSGIGYDQADASIPMSEDCLVLNVWTPGSDVTAKRPVFVWVHGGGTVGGSGATEVFDMSRLARLGDIVAITINHRLGILGYWHVAEILGEGFESAGNAATSDLIEALRWVRDNVASFGGDPDNVTLSGESGGGTKVSVLLGAPEARGLFHKIVPRSGTCLYAMSPALASERAAEVLDCFDPSVLADPASLVELDLDTLMAGQAAASRAPIGLNAFIPVLDGKVITEHPVDAVRDGMSAHVPILIGTCAHEFSGYLAVAAAGLTSALDEVSGDAAPAILAEYASRRPGHSPSDVFNDAFTDFLLRIPSLRLADARVEGGGAPVYVYRFDALNPQLDPPRASHSWDTAFFFDNVHISDAASILDGSQEIADATSGALLAFIRTGSPQHPGTPDWPPYDHHDRPTMVLDRHSEIRSDPGGDDRRVWDGKPVYGTDLGD